MKMLKEYLAEVGAKGFRIDNGRRKLEIYNSDDEIIKILVFAKSVDHQVTDFGLTNPNGKVGDWAYGVYLNDDSRPDYLWAAKIDTIL